MAKKPSAKAANKAKRAPKAKVGAPKKSPAPAKRGGRSEKYEQPGAPWWKQHLPS